MSEADEWAHELLPDAPEWVQAQIADVCDERDRLRQRVEELETKLSNAYKDYAVTMNGCECGRGKRPSYDKCLVCAYQERGERMKELWREYENGPTKEFRMKVCGWFDSEGEPL